MVKNLQLIGASIVAPEGTCGNIRVEKKVKYYGLVPGPCVLAWKDRRV